MKKDNGSHRRDLVAIGASAGGIEALSTLVGQLTPSLPAAVLVVQHQAPYSPGALAGILQRQTSLPVAWAEQGEAIEPGRVYVAPPDVHMLVDDAHVVLTTGPRENRSRPSINRLFRSTAARHGSRAIGVLLTGLLDD